MTDTAAETRTVVVEREIPYAPEKIWRALTQPHLIEEWLMKTDFELVVDPSSIFWRLGRRRLPGSQDSAASRCLTVGRLAGLRAL